MAGGTTVGGRGPVLLRLTFRDGQVARIPHVEWWQREANGDVLLQTYGNQSQLNRNILKAEVFSDDVAKQEGL